MPGTETISSSWVCVCPHTHKYACVYVYLIMLKLHAYAWKQLSLFFSEWKMWEHLIVQLDKTHRLAEQELKSLYQQLPCLSLYSIALTKYLDQKPYPIMKVSPSRDSKQEPVGSNWRRDQGGIVLTGLFSLLYTSRLSVQECYWPQQAGLFCNNHQWKKCPPQTYHQVSLKVKFSQLKFPLIRWLSLCEV